VSTVGSVREYLSRALPDLPGINEAARVMGLSERTLRRRLAEEGTSYKQAIPMTRPWATLHSDRHRLLGRDVEVWVASLRQAAGVPGLADPLPGRGTEWQRRLVRVAPGYVGTFVALRRDSGRTSDPGQERAERAWLRQMA
jgi:hypothetical protein